MVRKLGDKFIYMYVVVLPNYKLQKIITLIKRAEAVCSSKLINSYRIAGYFRGVLIFVIFVTSPGVTKFCTHEVFHLCYKLLVLLLT